MLCALAKTTLSSSFTLVKKQKKSDIETSSSRLLSEKKRATVSAGDKRGAISGDCLPSNKEPKMHDREKPWRHILQTIQGGQTRITCQEVQSKSGGLKVDLLALGMIHI